VHAMLASDVLSVAEPAARMATFLFQPLVPGTGAVMRRYAEITAWLLPEKLAAGFGLERDGEAGRLRFETKLRQLRRIWPYLPRRARYLPAYVEARRRIAGRTGKDPIGAALSRLLVGRAKAL